MDKINKLYTVSSLTAEIKALVEAQFPFVWVTGEISNFRVPVSGHFYFMLKDKNAQLNGVMFRGQNQSLSFVPEDGMQVTGLGRLNVYEPRGTYQLIFEYLEPKGVGALQIAFEQLKAKLTEEGLFDEAHKKPLPFLPSSIGVITSPSGAVVHDIIKVLSRRFPSTKLLVYPVRVQGDGADADIARGLKLLNRSHNIDVIILARGGGSLEDLHAFNTEIVARAIFQSEIPVISAIGHETDFTISDFVADLRAPTPSAAAELAVPEKIELKQNASRLYFDLENAMAQYLDGLRTELFHASARLAHPKKRLEDLRLRMDDLLDRMARSTAALIRLKGERLDWRTERLRSFSFQNKISLYKEILEHINGNILSCLRKNMLNKSNSINNLNGKLGALNPAAILERGYSITRTLPDRHIVKDSNTVEAGNNVHVLLSKGSLICRVERKK